MRWVILQAITTRDAGNNAHVSDLLVGEVEAPDRTEAETLAKAQLPGKVLRCVARVSWDMMVEETAARGLKPWWHVKRPRGAVDVVPPDPALRAEKHRASVASVQSMRKEKRARWIAAARKARGLE